MRTTKTAEQSQVKMTELVLPNDANLLGNLMGGRLLHWIDISGALAASRHANCIVTTVAIDSVVFKHPVKIGEMITLDAKLTRVGNTSMTVLVEVHSEDLKTGKIRLTNTATVTFVALNDYGNPTQVPLLAGQE